VHTERADLSADAKTKTLAARTQRKADARAKARRARDAAAAQREQREEDLAPSAQRHAVMSADGDVVREARVRRDGATFIRTSPLRNMLVCGERRTDRGQMAIISLEHVIAAERLMICWDLASEGIGLGKSDYGAARGGRGTAPLAPPGHEALVSQLRHRAELDGARAWLGSLWPVVRDVALKGVGVGAWAANVGMDRKAASGYLRAGLERLQDFYKSTEITTSGKIRTIAPLRDSQVIGGDEG
jgi:hypothetical protein